MVKDYANPSKIELYKLLYDAVDQLKDEVDISSFEIDDTEITNLTNAIWNRYNSEFFYIKNFTINEDKTKFIIKYNYDKETVTKMKNDFNTKVDYILNEVVKPNSSELEKEFAIHKYITENSHYNYDNDLSCDVENFYSILVNGKGICLGYTYTMRYLLNKVGIECYTVDSDEIAHMWNMVKIDRVYYHLDVTWGVGSNSLNYFNFTDDERKQNSDYQVWYGGNRNFVRTTLPVCDNTRFQYLRDAINPYLNDGWFYYSNINDDYKLYKIRTDGTDNTKICDDMAGSITADNMWVYYCNSNDNGYLYKIKKDGTEKTLFNKVSAFKVSINNDELSYFDVATEKENKIKLELDKMDIDLSNCNIEEYPQVIGPRTNFFVTFNKKIDDDCLINKNIFLLDTSNNIIDIKLDIENYYHLKTNI